MAHFQDDDNHIVLLLIDLITINQVFFVYGTQFSKTGKHEHSFDFIMQYEHSEQLIYTDQVLYK